MFYKFFGIGILVLPVSVAASTYTPCSETETTNGTCFTCGDQCSVRLTYQNETDAAQQKNGTLAFSGTGAMYNYGSPYSDDPATVAPWYHLHSGVTNVVIEEGLTSVGSRTVYEMYQLKSLSLPESLEQIPEYAIYHVGLTSLSLPQNITFVSDRAFGIGPQAGESTNITNLSCDKAIQSQCEALLERWNKDISLVLSEQSNGEYYFNGKFYESVNDMMHNRPIKKRIYTIDEANKAAGKTNHVTIRYK